jgi:ribose transport system permease protein
MKLSRPYERPVWTLAALALVALVAINGSLQPGFFGGSVMQSNLTTFLPLVLVAIGQTYVVLGGDIDLSVGAVAALVNVVTVSTMAAQGNGPAAIAEGVAAGLAAAVACGLVNGLLIARLRLQPMVTTFATAILFSAAALKVLPQAGLEVPETYWGAYAGAYFGIPTVLIILALALGFVVFLARRPFLSWLMAVGGNRSGAFQSGLPLDRIRIGAFLLSSIFSGLAALCLTGETATGDPLLGQSLGMGSISAVALGGTLLSGGVGGAIGSMLGALLLGMIGNVIFFAGLPYEYQTLVQGLIVLAALAGGVIIARR